MNNKRKWIFRGCTLLVVLLIAALMFVVGRGHTVYIDNKTLEYNGESYQAVCDPESDDENLEAFILKIETDENGQDFYTVPDDDVSDAVFQQLVDMTEELGDD